MMAVVDDPEGKGCAYASKEGGGCQFTLAAHELVAFDGKHWCPFHLPMTQKTSWEEAKVETFNRAIFDFIEDANQKNRIADFTGVVFPGPISFEHFLTAERPLREIKFIGATFSGEAGFRNATFSGEAGFQDATFSGDAGFQNATFSAHAEFQNATFSLDAEFQNATFSDYARFENATFSGDADFSCSSGTSKASSDIALAHDAFGHSNHCKWDPVRRCRF